MASQQGTVDFLLDQISGAGSLSVKKVFGEYGVHCDGKMFAIVADDHLSSSQRRLVEPGSAH